MKKKKEDFYYKNLNACADYSFQAATLLKEIISNYDKKTIKNKLEDMHELEQKADSKKHKMMTALSQAFITPIEREDLVSLSNNLDDITDSVEDLVLQIYMSNIPTIREDFLPMVDLLIESIHALCDVLGELKNFKHSKSIDKLIIRVNDLEEQGDTLFMKSMRRLHEEDDLRTIIVWRKIYEHMEDCIDTCEHAADIVTMVTMKNS